MTPDELKVLTNIYESLLNLQEFQNTFARVVLAEFQQRQRQTEHRRQIDALPDGDEKRGLLAQLNRLEFEFDSGILFDELRLQLERSAADHARMSALLAALRAGEK
jgi:hypothetical protein